MPKVKSVKYNWRQVGSVQDRDGAGDDWDRYTVGEKNVISITEITLDGFNYLVKFQDGSACRIFNPNFVEYSSI